MKSLILAAFSLLVVAEAYFSYDGYKVYKVVPRSEQQVKLLSDLEKNFDFWTDIYHVGSEVRIMVSPAQENEFALFSKSSGLNYTVAVNNVQELIEAQLIPATGGRSVSHLSLSWNQYYNIEQINAYLDELQEAYPDYVNTVTIGTTSEGRPIKGVVIDFRRGSRGDRPLTAMIEGGIHAREWISPATVTWIIKEFLTSQDADVRLLAETFVWHMFPVVNPDGYAFTFSNNRMWRKNRNPANFVPCSPNNDVGNGIDLNRNFNFVWMTIGASSNPCTITYAGPHPASELETQAIQNYVQNLKDNTDLIYYFAFHSFSQLILVPYSHLSAQSVGQPENYADLYEIASAGVDKLRTRHGTPYLAGTSLDILYAVSGSSFDWVKSIGVPIVYLFELRDVGEYGFLLPTSQIVGNNEEIVDCLVEMDNRTRTLGYYSHGVNVATSALSLVMGVFFLALVR